MSSLLSAAKGFIKKRISVIATDENKRAIVSWKPYQEKIPTAGELDDQFAMSKARGLAIICGAVSGNLEVIDVDIKYDITGTLFENLMSLIYELSADLSERL